MKKIYSLFLILLFSNLNAQFFTKITSGPLATTPGDSRSVNWIDVNNDGWVDCFISNGPSGGQNNSLFINNSGTGFTAVTGDSIVLDNKPSDGATFADLDNDGDMDAFVVNWYNVNNLMYINNGSGSFTKIDTGKIVNDGGYSETASWGDYDNDGYVDLYVTNSSGLLKNYMYHNNGNKNFTKILTGTPATDAFKSRSVNWTDMDGDNDLDLFVTNEGNQNENIYRNDGAGSFTKLTTGPLVTNLGSTMSSSWSDIDNDGDLDVFLANELSVNALFKNNGGFNFTKITNDTCVKSPARSFSTAFSDVDNDGDEDLFVTNAFSAGVKQVNFFYLNNGNGTFTRNTVDIISKDSAWSYGCAFGDYDNDGFEDLSVATCRYNSVDVPDFLYHNNTNSNKWITIKLIGTISNKAAIGTKIRVKAIIGGTPVWQMREISAQNGYCSQNDIRAHFGLGNASVIDSIKIEWPSGIKEFFTNVAVNQFTQYIEGATTTSIKENKKEIEFVVFPNPADSFVQVTIPDKTKTYIVKLFDVSGKLLLNGEINSLQNKLEMSKIPNGLYFIYLNEINGKPVASSKLEILK